MHLPQGNDIKDMHCAYYNITSQRKTMQETVVFYYLLVLYLSFVVVKFFLFVCAHCIESSAWNAVTVVGWLN